MLAMESRLIRKVDAVSVPCVTLLAEEYAIGKLQVSDARSLGMLYLDGLKWSRSLAAVLSPVQASWCSWWCCHGEAAPVHGGVAISFGWMPGRRIAASIRGVSQSDRDGWCCWPGW